MGMTPEQYRKLVGADKLAQPTQVLGRPVRGATEQTRRVATECHAVLPFLPPGVNHMYVTLMRGGKMLRVPNPKYSKHKRLAEKILKSLPRLDDTKLYWLRIELRTSCYTKAGDVRKFDASNRVKFIEDVISKAVGVDDSRFFRVTVEKHDAAVTETEIWLMEIVK